MTTLAYLSMDRWGRGCIATYAAWLTVMHAQQKLLVRANGMCATAMRSASCCENAVLFCIFQLISAQAQLWHQLFSNVASQPRTWLLSHSWSVRHLR